MPETLTLRDVAYWYVRGRPVLEGVDLAVAPGEVVIVRGSNGSGKTTLLRVAAGLRAPRRGTVRRPAVTGYQPQTGDEPPPQVTVAQWLATVGRMRRDRARGAAGHDALDVLAALGLDEPDTQFGLLSRGTITKVLLAAALSGDPGLVILDEPFAPLDEAACAAAARLILDTAASGAAVLMSDHHGAAILTPTRTLHIAGHHVKPGPAPATQPAMNGKAIPAGQRGQWKIVLAAPGGTARELLVDGPDRDRTLLDALMRGDEVRGVQEIA